MNPKFKAIAKEYLESIVIALILALIVRTFIVQAFKIPTGSMRPTLIEGDRILVNKFIYFFRAPQRGEVIVFKSPEDRKKDFIKRLVGLPKETVEIAIGTILVNGEPIKEPGSFQQRFYYNRGEYGAEGKKIEVPEECYFVLGDNSISSRDSRYWGFLFKRDIIGKAFLIYWPVTRIRIIR